MSGPTYPGGIVVTAWPHDDDDSIRWRTSAGPSDGLRVRGSASATKFVARCIRLANPPDPATRQVWQEADGTWWGHKFGGLVLLQEAIYWWHYWDDKQAAS